MKLFTAVTRFVTSGMKRAIEDSERFDQEFRQTQREITLRKQQMKDKQWRLIGK